MRANLIGILNITPDSFSDGGMFANAATAAARCAALIAEGADYVDLGAESTRPGATPLTADAEWARLSPALDRLCSHAPRLSIDTRHAQTVRQALAQGVAIINDVSGLLDPAMREVLAAAKCDIVVMHSLSIPADKAVTLPEDCDPIEVVLQWKQRVTALAQQSGIDVARLIFDPGIGFGKTPQQSLALILRASELVSNGGHWLYGHSRKSFLTLFTNSLAQDRDALTLAFSASLAAAGVQYLRVHNVAAHRALWKL